LLTGKLPGGDETRCTKNLVPWTRLRLGRCFPGRIYVVDAPLGPGQWPAAIAYEWAATLKALLFQRGC
jgi:hypothetical protein